ncbi:hypothetical protein AB6A40_003095 [Gnathostoma spinigerum]|uniref:Uncharacterized protein n=1 Tax=Gnathostoma spinigerum TaxID=75299 RepID=A0ABD6E9T9_9BILA
MFLPDGGGHELRLPLASNESGEVHCVVGNRERSLYAVVTSSTIYVFLPNPQLILCSFRRTTEDVTEKGEYRLLYWKHDSTAVCLTTSKNCILVYRVEINDDRQCYNLTEPRDEHLRRCSQELFIKEKRPTVTISLAILARLESPAACVVPLRDEIFVCLRDGWMHRILWNGLTEAEYSFHLSDVPFAVDQLQSKCLLFNWLLFLECCYHSAPE